MIYFVLRLSQRETVDKLFTPLLPSMQGRMEKLTYADLFAKSTVPAGVYVFTGLDQLPDVQKKAAVQIWDQLLDTGSVLLNHPEHALDRYELLWMLYKEGLNEFRAFRASEFAEAEPAFPVFVRSDVRHGGPLSPLLHSKSEVESAIQEARRWGHAVDDLIVVEYCHVKDSDGYFRKYSAFRVGARIIPAHLSHGFFWAVKGGSAMPKAGNEDLAAEELRFIQGNPHEAHLMRVFEIAQIQYGRIDYGIREGRLQVWEINTAPYYGYAGRHVGSKRSRERLARGRTRSILYGSLDASLRELENGVVPGIVTIDLDKDLLPQIRREQRVERSTVRAMRIQRVARAIGLNRLGRLRLPLSRFLSRRLNRSY